MGKSNKGLLVRQLPVALLSELHTALTATCAGVLLTSPLAHDAQHTPEAWLAINRRPAPIRLRAGLGNGSISACVPLAGQSQVCFRGLDDYR